MTCTIFMACTYASMIVFWFCKEGKGPREKEKPLKKSMAELKAP
jgi:hypothetical protein